MKINKRNRRKSFLHKTNGLFRQLISSGKTIIAIVFGVSAINLIIMLYVVFPNHQEKTEYVVKNYRNVAENQNYLSHSLTKSKTHNYNQQDNITLSLTEINNIIAKLKAIKGTINLGELQKIITPQKLALDKQLFLTHNMKNKTNYTSSTETKKGKFSTKYNNTIHSKIVLQDIKNKTHLRTSKTILKTPSNLQHKMETALSSKRSATFFQHQFSNVSNQNKVQLKTNTKGATVLLPCIEKVKNLVSWIKPSITFKSRTELTAMFPNIELGGYYHPLDCQPKEKTVIIFPYRNRYHHLHVSLLNILPLLMKQKVDFTIFVIEQVLPGVFNRGMLLNIGFLEAIKLDNFDCFIFHDVDLVPVKENNFYHCNNQPTHFISGVDKFNHSLMYTDMFGGVVAFTRKQFLDINGASNLYFGWGGEDDDLLRRFMNKGYTIQRKDTDIGQYNMIKHTRDKTNEANPFRGRLVKKGKERQDIEGLNTSVYKVLTVDLLSLYTWVKVRINVADVIQTIPDSMKELKDNIQKHYLEEQMNTTVV